MLKLIDLMDISLTEYLLSTSDYAEVPSIFMLTGS